MLSLSTTSIFTTRRGGGGGGGEGSFHGVSAFVGVVPVTLHRLGPGVDKGVHDNNNNNHNRGTSSLCATKKKKKKQTNNKKGRGGGFGSGGSDADNATTTTTVDTSAASTTRMKPVRADKNSLETQWDAFAAITDLEIKPFVDSNTTNYFEVADVFVRSSGGGNSESSNSKSGEEDTVSSSSSSSTGWFRIGKICVAGLGTVETNGTQTTTTVLSLEAALTLQKGLIFWTAVHMRRELRALGKQVSLELGYIVPPIVYMGTETDGPIEDDEAAAYLQIHNTTKVTINSSHQHKHKHTQPAFGFRPDWNPPGFTYKRRESAALKK